jgi:hypothetical protein
VPEDNRISDSESDAEFIGWQETMTGAKLALYNVTAPLHRLFRSTVSAKTLNQEHIKVPPTPDSGGNGVERRDHEE